MEWWNDDGICPKRPLSCKSSDSRLGKDPSVGGVSCNDKGRVNELDLGSRWQKNSESLRGTINLSSLLHLEFLEYLDLSYNDFEGTISFPSVVNNSKLSRLDLSFNSHLHMENLHWLSPLSSLGYLGLSGIHLHDQTNWPHSLSSLPSLFELKLKGCNLTNIYPYDKNVTLSKLAFLDLAQNNFNTQLPHWLFNLSTELWFLNLSHCNFRGQIPDWFDKLNRLSYLDLSNNLFHGPIPSNLPNSSTIQILDISFNDLSGNLPKSFERHFQFLDLSHNSLSGDISNFLLSSAYISMPFNKFEGGLPHLSHEVKILDLAHNSFSGSLSPLLCHTQNNHKNRLFYMDISSNYLAGDVPDCWHNWKELYCIYLGSNKLSGEIPPTIASLPRLHLLDLHDNELYGHIPWSFHHSSTLSLINLERNNFFGSITNWMPQNISFVNLRSNQFSGNIPSQLCGLSSIIVLDLANNTLSGWIPHCLNNLTSLVTGIWNNGLTSYIVYDGGVVFTFTFKMTLSLKGQQLDYSKTLRLVRSIDLSLNKLCGEIPPQLFQLIKLQSLNLSYNHLTGKVPDEIGMMKDMESLDLSHNKFDGEIPQDISSLSFLSDLNLSYNNFDGKIPVGTQLQSFNESSFIGNPELCGAPLKNCTEPEEQKQEELEGGDEDEYFWKSLYVGMGVGFAVGFWMVSGSIFFIRTWRHRFFRWFDGVVDQIYVIVALKCRNLNDKGA
ncbi:receptor-like protein EIX2 [Senna tora]|uniref:Receptor-like protein EIX2 n=1 Tax=Senna tora TaxID=362788 RepID=A0A834T7X8_9FABA|nr:receptor-like protein EIX2 [Senna tora]